MSDDVYECVYQPRYVDSLSVSVMYSSQPVARSPYQVRVDPVSSSRMKARGPGLTQAVAGYPASFVVETNDEPGSLGTVICRLESRQCDGKKTNELQV